jgi:hypothetical protein
MVVGGLAMFSVLKRWFTRKETPLMAGLSAEGKELLGIFRQEHRKAPTGYKSSTNLSGYDAYYLDAHATNPYPKGSLANERWQLDYQRAEYDDKHMSR